MSLKFRLLKPMKLDREYDVVIVGAGPAGLTAALYSARFMLKTLVIADDVGGTLNDAGEVDDYPGIPSIQGPDLAKKFESHVVKYKVPILRDTVVDIRRNGGGAFKVITKKGKEFVAQAVILAVGSKRRKLGVPGEDRLSGRGVTYCAPCDAPMFRGKVVAVVGGGNSALQAAVLLSSYANKVYLIHRRDKFRAFPVYVKLVTQDPKIELVLNHVVAEIGGEEKVEWVRVRNVKTGEEKMIELDGVVIEIGSEPPREFFQKIGIEIDEKGHALVDKEMRTSIEGIYAAGDCAAGPCKKKFDQVVTAAAEGAIAALSAYEYIMRKKSGEVETPTFD